MMESEQTSIRIASREDMLYLLAEATAIEQNRNVLLSLCGVFLRRSAEEGWKTRCRKRGSKEKQGRGDHCRDRCDGGCL